MLERLQNLLGDVPPPFWATCDLCDLQQLTVLVRSHVVEQLVVAVELVAAEELVAVEFRLFLRYEANLRRNSVINRPRSQANPLESLFSNI